MTDPAYELLYAELVRQTGVTVAAAAQIYGRSKRTVRRWCEESEMAVRFAGGSLLVPLPLLRAWTHGGSWRDDVRAFLAGKPASQALTRSFEMHSVSARRALAEYETARLLIEKEQPPVRLKVAGRPRP